MNYLFKQLTITLFAALLTVPLIGCVEEEASEPTSATNETKTKDCCKQGNCCEMPSASELLRQPPPKEETEATTVKNDNQPKD